VVIKAKANPGFTFAAWAGTGTGSYTGTNNPGFDHHGWAH